MIGEHIFQVYCSDNSVESPGALSSFVEVKVAIRGANNPVLFLESEINLITLSWGEAYILPLPTFQDYDEDDEHTISHTSLPSFVSFDEQDEKFSFLPIANWTEVGHYDFFITVEDNNSAQSASGITSDTIKVTIFVMATREAEEEEFLY